MMTWKSPFVLLLVGLFFHTASAIQAADPSGVVIYKTTVKCSANFDRKGQSFKFTGYVVYDYTNQQGATIRLYKEGRAKKYALGGDMYDWIFHASLPFAFFDLNGNGLNDRQMAMPTQNESIRYFSGSIPEKGFRLNGVSFQNIAKSITSKGSTMRLVPNQIGANLWTESGKWTISPPFF